ncbi:hypothetical protein ABTD52_18260, partial [Acinetobacter baumannii]
NVAQRHGDGRSQDESYYQFHTYADLKKRLLDSYSEKSIAQAIKYLESLDFFSTHKNPNPRYSFDKTTFYLFHPEVCN